jgi:hypothetical protein
VLFDGTLFVDDEMIATGRRETAVARVMVTSWQTYDARRRPRRDCPNFICGVKKRPRSDEPGPKLIDV